MRNPLTRRGAGRWAGPAVLVAALAGCPGTGQDEVAFGLAGPLAESYGVSTEEGATLAVEQINARGRGVRVRLERHDDRADGSVAIDVAQSLVAERAVVAVAGHVNSGTTMAAAHYYSEGRLPALATTATSPLISGLGPWIFRVASSDSANAVALADHATRMSRRIAVLYANDAYGRGLAAAFTDALPDGVVTEASPYLESTEDFRPYLRRMVGRGVTLVFVAGLEDGAARIIAQAREVGLDARFLGGDGLEGLVDMGAAYDGTMVGLLFHPDANERAREFASAYRQRFGSEPNSFAAAAYDAVMLLAAAANDRGADREGIRQYLSRVGRGETEFEGVTGTIRFDENGDPHQKDFHVGVIRNGAIQLLGDNR